MKKKLVTICLVVALVLVAAGGSLAYFTDTDEQTNTMVVGGVDIKQVEVERADDGALKAFEQNQDLFPAVGPIEWADEAITVGGGEQKVFTDELNNVIDKFVYVNNTGKSAAYVRTIVALEAPGYDAKDLIHVNVNDTDGVTATPWAAVDIDGVQYVYSVFTYTEALAPKASTPVSLAQVFIDSVATNEDMAAYGETWEILCLSQAVQEAGFDNAATALDAAFGEATAENVATWF